MAVIAVAGGSHGLGRKIVEAWNAQGNHEAVVFSRKSNPDLEKELHARVVALDYNDVDAIVFALETNKVDTVISTINSIMDTEPERNLILAADRSRNTRRFIPSVFAGFTYPIKYPDIFPPARAKLAAIQELEKTSLEYTAFYNGMFLDYYDPQSAYQPLSFFVDIAHDSAAIPGTGNIPIAFSHTSDVAKFVVASLKLQQWQEESYVICDKVTWKEFVEIAEEVKGSKFSVVHDDETDLKAGKVTELPMYQAIYASIPKEALQALLAQTGLWSEMGEMDLTPLRTLNQEFPEIKAMSVKDFLTVTWKRK